MILYSPMKKFLTMLSFLLCTFVVSAQTNSVDVAKQQNAEQKKSTEAVNPESVEALKARIAMLERQVKRMKRLRAENRRLRIELSRLRASAMAGKPIDSEANSTSKNKNDLDNNFQPQEKEEESETIWDWLTK